MVLKKDYPYLFIASFLSVLAVLTVADPGESVGAYALLGLIGIGVVMAIMINPSLGANILFITVFSNLSDQLTDNGLPGVNKPLVVIVFVAIMVRSYYIGQLPTSRPKTSRIEMALIAYFFAVTTSFLVASDRDLALNRIIDLGKDIIIIYCILFCLRLPKEWKNTVFLVVFVTTILCMLGLYQVVTGDYDQTFYGFARVIEPENRLGGPINESNIWGQVLVAVIPFAIFGFLRESLNKKLVYAAFLTVLIIALLNTYSRGGYLAFLVVMVLIMFFFTKFNPTFVLSVVLIGLFIFPFIPPRYVERFQTLYLLSPDSQDGVYQESSFRGRASEMLTGLAMLAEHPLLGVGAANYPVNYQKYTQIVGLEVRSEEREAHSLYVEVLAETGIIGFTAFMALIFFLFRALSNIKVQLRTTKYYDEWVSYISAMQVSLAGYLFAAIFLHGAYDRFFWLLVALCLTLVQIIHERISAQPYLKSSEISSE
jgi:putative inorganic carbon (hco3(-)) transporter